MTPFVQIPIHLVCRFSELTKTEIVVVSYLYASRNRKTGQCNPSRATIGRAVGIDRSHISKALAELDHKGWVIEMPDGNFCLCEEPEKRAKSARAKSAPPVRNPPQDEAKSASKAGEIRPHTYKDSSEQMKNRLLTEGDAPANEFDVTPVALYLEFYPEANPNIWQMECITDRVSDLERWHRALTVWKTNNWVGRNIANILDYYDKHTERDEKYGKPSTDYRQDREQQAINDRNFFDRLRAEIDLTDRQLQETDASGGSGQFRTLGPKPDDGRESLPC